MTAEAGIFKIYTLGQQTGDPKKELQFESQNSLFLNDQISSSWGSGGWSVFFYTALQLIG